MKNRMLSLAIMLIAMFSVVSPFFAKTETISISDSSVFARILGVMDRYVVREDGYGGYIIEDSVEKRCIVSIEVEKDEREGYNFFCNGNSHRRIRSGMQLAGILAGYLGAGVAGSLSGWAAGLIYDEVCAYFR